MIDNLRRKLPNLPIASVTITSDATPEYNCVAWAVGENERWWEAGMMPDSYWPAEALNTNDLRGWMEAFRSEGFEVSADSAHEVGFEKIAIYLQGGVPTHAARQLPNGRWTSKIGGLEDVEHDLSGLRDYGDPLLFMRRQLR